MSANSNVKFPGHRGCGGWGCLIFLFCLLVMPVAGVAQTIYKIDNTIPVASDGVSTNGRIPIGTATTKGDFKNVSSGPVIKTESGYMMWYSGLGNDNRWRIYLATSPDAMTWTKYSNSVPASSDSISRYGALGLGSGDRGDSNHAQNPTVIREGGIFKMWYTGIDYSVQHDVYSPFAPYARIFHATSTNGIDWIKYNNFIVPSSDGASGAGRVPPGISPRGDHLHSSAPCVIRDGALYRMWYTGERGGTFANGKTSTIFCATSVDGLTWTKVANSVPAKSDVLGDLGRIPLGVSLDRGDARHVSGARVIQQGMNYLMWYAGNSTSGNWRIYHATSSDGLSWNKIDTLIPARSDEASSNGCISAGNVGRGDGSHVVAPVVLEDGPVYRVWYTGIATSGVNRVYAAAWTSDVPNVHISGVSNISSVAATLYGELTSTGTADTAVWCYWGTTDEGTNLGAWASNTMITTSAAPGPFSIELSGLTPDAAYAFRFQATNSNGQCISAPLGSFITAPVEIQSPWRGGFVISRPSTATNLNLAVNYSISGTATNWVDYYPLSGQEWIRAGATSVAISVRANVPERLTGKTVTLTLEPGGYLMGGSTSATTSFEPAIWYVATNGVDGVAGTNSEVPLRTVAHAMERAINGDMILVGSGTHLINDMLCFDTGVTLRGASSDRSALIKRNGSAASMPYYRVTRVNHTNAILDGVRLEGGSALNDCDPLGGGVKLLNGTITNCTIANNICKPGVGDPGGCGAYVAGGVITDSTIAGNHNNNAEGMQGGGLYIGGGTVRRCIIERNYISDDGISQGGGVFIASGLLSHCTIRSNYVIRYSINGKAGGGIYSTGGTVRNCLLYANWSSENAGGGYVAGGNWQNCVVIGNSAGTAYGGLYVSGGSATNTIVYNNFASTVPDVGGSWATRVAYSCAPELTSGIGNITNSPMFVDIGTGTGTGSNTTYRPGDYHLLAGSPCLNRGIVQSWMAADVDFDGKARARSFVDMGIFQRAGSGTMILVH